MLLLTGFPKTASVSAIIGCSLKSTASGSANGFISVEVKNAAKFLSSIELIISSNISVEKSKDAAYSVSS